MSAQLLFKVEQPVCLLHRINAADLPTSALCQRWDVFTQVHPFDGCSLDVVTDLSGFWASGGRSTCELQLERQKHRERVTVTVFPNMSSFIALPSCYVCTDNRAPESQRKSGVLSENFAADSKR